jgi:molecular chaperone DnaK (HSP70)
MAHQYRGHTRRLVIAFDIGTTYSGIAYCLLDPGEEPKIQSVTKYVHLLASSDGEQRLTSSYAAEDIPVRNTRQDRQRFLH